MIKCKKNLLIIIAAHELRTPTQSIVAYSELLEMEPERSES